MIHPTEQQNFQANSKRNQELSRIISAAVINNHFRSLLLNDPQSAVSNGYGGEHFALESEALEKLRSIKAGNLADFAAQLTII